MSNRCTVNAYVCTYYMICYKPHEFLLQLFVFLLENLIYSNYYTCIISPFLDIFILLKDIKGFVDKFVGVLQGNKIL